MCYDVKTSLDVKKFLETATLNKAMYNETNFTMG